MSNGMFAPTRRQALTGGAAATVLAATSAQAASTVGGDDRGAVRIRRTLVGPAWHGKPVATAAKADLGYIDVPADHRAAANEGRFTLRFARFLAKRPSSAPPVFYLYGGPSAANDLWGYIDSRYNVATTARFIDTVTDYCDLVLIDHRGGYGCPYPRLVPTYRQASLPFRDAFRDLDWAGVQGGLCKAVIQDWADAGIDLKLFNTPQLVMDMDRVRRALGYDQIVLMADSNGTYRAREYLRRFNAKVQRALLFVSHGYQKAPWPRDVRAALRRIDRDVAADRIVSRHFRSIGGLMDDLTSRFNARPVIAPFKTSSGATGQIAMDGGDLVGYFWRLMTNNQNILKAPSKLWALHKGDLAELAAASAEARLLGEDGVDPYDVFGGAAMPTADEAMAYAREAGTSLYLNRLNESGRADVWPVPRDDKAPFVNRVPVTYVMGEWDLRTPAEALDALDDRSRRVLLNGAQGHESGIDNSDGEFWEEPMIRAFFEDRELSPRSALSRDFGAAFT